MPDFFLDVEGNITDIKKKIYGRERAVTQIISDKNDCALHFKLV